MPRDVEHDDTSTRGYVAVTGAMIGAGIGIVWLHSAVVEACLFALLGAFLAWTLAGEWRRTRSLSHATDGDGALIETEPMPLVPMLSWPAPFPVQIPATPRENARTRDSRRVPIPPCTATRRHATSARARRTITRGVQRRTRK